MKKSEMEAHAVSYDAAMARAREAERAGLYRLAVSTALAACKHADGMMRHQKKYADREFDSVSAIDFILRLAPLLLDEESIDEVEQILKASKRVAKNTATDEVQDVAAARSMLWKCHRLWHHLESRWDVVQSDLRLKLGGDQDEWRSIAEAWDRMGLLRRVPQSNSYVLSITTYMDESTEGKCPSCGSIAEAPKAMFLEPTRCPHCQDSVLFVLVSTSQELE